MSCGLNLSRGSNMVGFTLDCISFFKISAGTHDWNRFLGDLRRGLNWLNSDTGFPSKSVANIILNFISFFSRYSAVISSDLLLWMASLITSVSSWCLGDDSSPKNLKSLTASSFKFPFYLSWSFHECLLTLFCGIIWFFIFYRFCWCFIYILLLYYKYR